MRIEKSKRLACLPAPWPQDVFPEIQARIRDSGTKLVVLDDDPTGTQTVHGVPVLTEWSVDTLERVLTEPGTTLYISTNSRSMPLAQVQEINRQIAAHLKAAATAVHCDLAIVSRSDSTLRGHYPGEVQALIAGLGQHFDGTLIIPFFLEGGRLTINDVHYVTEGEWMVPAAETEYACDAAFGYHHSNLRAWVSEKHGGQIAPHQVASISLADLRRGGPDIVAQKLEQIRDGQVCVVNAATYRDIEILVAGLLRAEAAGKRFIYRTAASFVRVRGGIAPHGLLTTADLHLTASKRGGLIVVGSHVQKTTRQVEAVRALPGIYYLEVAVERLLDETARRGEIEAIADAANRELFAGKEVMICTSRQLIAGQDSKAALNIGRIVSQALVKIVQLVSEQPAWVIAKGGITSSDVASQGLNVKRADVLGQAIPGIPIWRLGAQSRWPGLVYAVFPGNVGGVDALADMINILRG